MEKIIETLILAIVQGVGEFLPISSSGHIIAVNDLFLLCRLSPLADPLLLGIMLHFGTLLAVFVVFWRRIISLFTTDRRVLALILFGSIPAVVIGVPLEKYGKHLLESSLLTGFCFIGTALLLLYTIKIEKSKPSGTQYKNMTFYDAFFVGLCQGIAILPGFSRSGFTIVGGLLRKLKREDAATFSFLLAIPVIGGKGLLEIAKLLQKTSSENSDDISLLFLGMFVSFSVGVISLIWLLKWLQQGKLHYFAYWLMIVGPLVILISATGNTKIIKPTSETGPQLQTVNNESVSQEDSLIRLHETEPIWVTKDKKSVVFVAEICLREGLLELFACRKGSKEHESIISTTVTPHLIHAGLLVTGAEPGKPAQFSPEFIPPSGPEIEVFLQWQADENGQLVVHQYQAQHLVCEVAYEDEDEKKDEPNNNPEPETFKEMSVPFVFTGSFFRELEDENGDKRNVYMADVSGEIFGVSNFPSSILDVPIASTDSNDSLLFAPFTERIPELGTPVKVILTPKK